MKKDIFIIVVTALIFFKSDCSALLFDDVPKILVRNGNLVFESAQDKNITISLKGKSWLNVNDVDVLKLINNLSVKRAIAGDDSSTGSGVGYDVQLATLRSALFGDNGLEKRVNELENITRNARTNVRFRNLQQRLRRLETKIETLKTKSAEDNCRSNPCQNGGSCIDLYDTFMCKCLPNWEGVTCGEDVNECAEFAGTVQGCQNGADCVNTPGSYSCICKPGWIGIHCTQRNADCMRSSATELCGHGTCLNSLAPPGYACLCEQGWKTNGLTPACTVDINECEEAKPPCVSTCINLPGSFTCGPCPSGFTGNGFVCRDINECESDNGGCSTNPRVPCINSYGSFHCGECPIGWTGDGKHCTRSDTNTCSRNICHPAASCAEISNLVVCTCPAGMVGDGVGPNGCSASTSDPCQNRCKNGGTCIRSERSYACSCPPGFLPPNCEVREDPCHSNPCQNGGTCVIQSNRLGYRCRCTVRYRGRQCQSVRTRCGGILTEETGTLKYPLIDSYDRNARCAWLIRTQTAKVLEVNFTKFELESSAGCSFDWLQIHDGGSSAARSIGRFCGSELPKGGRIVTTENKLYLWFRSDNSTSHSGFEMNWRAIDPVCGGTIETSTFGTISSPGSPSNYPPNRDCEWHVDGPFGKRIQLTFFVMALEAHDDCGFDYLAIYDGSSRERNLLQKFCNSSHPSPLITSSNQVTLYFHSDADNTDAGFQIHYAVVEGTPGCGGIFTQGQGLLRSPLIDENYPPNMNCDYLIKLPVESRIKLQFKEFEMEYAPGCLYDYIEIYNGETDQDPKINRYCGSQVPPALVSDSNALLIRFVTDFDDGYKGFQLSYDTICGGIFKDPEGVLTSPMYPSTYAHSRTCLYEISAPLGKAIKLSFQDFDIEGNIVDADNRTVCDYDSLEIIEGVDKKSSFTYCGTRNPPDGISSSNLLTLKMTTDESVGGRGFKANYSFVDVGCGGVLKEPHLVIKPPPNAEYNDGTYQHNANCEWVIAAPVGNLIHLNWISFNLEEASDCIYDFVEIYDNNSEDGTKIGRFCGTNKPPTITSSSNVLTIKFQSDTSDSGEGFIASYQFLDGTKACGGNIFSQTGVLKSPDYPNQYPADRTCVWTLAVPAGNQIELKVKRFDLESESNCDYDYLEIRNGVSETSPLIGKYCGSEIPKLIPSFSNQLYLKFVSDYSSGGAGFEIEWDGSLSGCGGQITTYRGTITSPNYPGPYNDNAQCDWRISVSKGSSVDILIPELSLESSSTCFYDYLDIFEGFGLLNHKVGRYCSSNELIHIRTHGNEALVRFVSDVSNANRGFQLSYSTNCNNELTEQHGIIESPNFPGQYPDNMQCKWIIKGRPNSKIVLHVSHLELEENLFADVGEDPCFYDYIEIAEKAELRFKTIEKLCKKSSKTFETTAEEMQIIFKTDESGRASGFRMEYRVEGCGGIVKRSEGELTSPEYPNNYPHNSYCEWIIQAEAGHLVELNITDLQVEAIGECSYDGLLVANGRNGSHEIALYCGRVFNSTTVRSNGNLMFLRFFSDMTSNGRGFRALYRQVEAKCGGTFRTNKGSIHSPNYPHNYEPNLECQWLIQVDDFNSIRFKFKEFDLEPSFDCSHDYVVIYDGDEVKPDNLLLRHCGADLPDITLNSTKSNKMLVVMHSDENMEYKGFAFDYWTGCGKRIFANDTGSLIMTTNDNDDICVWFIVTEPGQHITFTTTHFEKSIGTSLRSSSNVTTCDNFGVKFYDGDSTTSPLKESFCEKFPHTMTSRGNALTIELEATSISGFEGFFTVYENACGGNLTSLSGTFASPLYPDSYPVNIECVWWIEATPGNEMDLIIEQIDMEESDNCNGDYLEIRAGGPLGRLIDISCGKLRDVSIRGEASYWIKFSSNNDGVGKGFLARYSYVHDVDISGMNGTVTSPRYPNQISDFTQFNWRITVPQGNVIQVSFSERADGIQGFYNQKFMIYNGYDESASLLPLERDEVSFTSSTSSIYIATILPLFKIKWQAVSKAEIQRNTTAKDECKSVVTVGLMPFMFASPGYPTGYKENLDCEWLAQSNSSLLHPLLHLLAVDIDDTFGCYADYIQVLTSKDLVKWDESPKICKRGDNGPMIYEGTPHLKLIFHTDFFNNKTGFSAMFVGKCGGEFTAPSGVINTSKVGGQDCSWKFRVQRGRKIKFKFTELSLPKSADGSCAAYVMMKNGEDEESPILGSGKYCGTEIPEIPTTTSNRAFVKYSNILQSGSMVLSYETVMNECEYSLTLDDTYSQINIQSPNFPNIPAPHTVCVWTVIAPKGEHIQINFENFTAARNTDCVNEYVQTKDGATELAPTLGVACSQPNTIDSSSNAVRIKFFSDVTDPSIMFNGTVSIGKCGGTYHELSGQITSKNYPHVGLYPSNSICEYRIVLPIEVTINITFHDIHLPAGDCKLNDHLEVTYISPGMENSTETSEYNFCGGYTRPYLTVNDNEVLLRFHTYKPNTIYRGFKLTYTSSRFGCGGNINAEEGIISTPGYPNGWASTVACIWRITVPKGRRIHLEMLDYHVPIRSAEPVVPYIPLRRSSTRIGFFNDHRYLSNIGYFYNSPPLSINSSDNQMLISCWLSQATGYRGIKMRFSSNEATICRGSLQETTGSIALPASNNSFLCSYDAPQTSAGETIAMKFRDFRLTQSLMRLPCEFRPPVSILDGKRAWLKLCQNTTETILRSPFMNTKLQILQTTLNKMVSFNMTYKRNKCGGIVPNNGRYSIVTPLLPQPIPSEYGELDCAWVIGSSNKDYIFKISGHVNIPCEKEYLRISRGVNGLNLGRFCGDVDLTNLTSLREAFIEYHSDEFDPKSAMNITIEDIDECGDHFFNSPHTIQLKNDYKSNVECIWTIKANSGYHLRASFVDRYYIEESANCSKDVLELYDSRNGDWTQIGRSCGRNIPAPFESTEDMIRVKFKSDDSVQGDGFSIRFENKCGGTYVVTDTVKTLTSPNYPERYHGNLNCNYTLVAPNPDDFIVVRFLDFTIEQLGCHYDNLTVYSYSYGSYEKVGTYCNADSLSELSYKDRMTMVFKTDGNANRQGFKLEYSIRKCGGEITSTQQITSPTHGAGKKYAAYLNCVWNITAPRDKEIRIVFEEFETESSSRCYFDYVQIFKGNKELDTNKVATLCGNLTGKIQPISIDTNHAIIHFNTDPSNSGKGFRAWILFKDKCDETIGLNIGNPSYVFDNFYGSSYKENMDCNFVFNTPDGYHIQVEFEQFHVATCDGNVTDPCSCDYLELRDGAGPFAELIDRYCGHEMPPMAFSTRTKMYARFVSDSSKTSSGIKATFKMVASKCGPMKHELEDTTGITLKTPGDTYPSNLRCLWEISSSKYQLHVHFKKFDLQGSGPDGCTNDVLQIYSDESAWLYDNGLDNNVVKNGADNGIVTTFADAISRNAEGRMQYCGNHTPEDYYSNSNKIFVNFKSDGDIQKSGVEFTVTPISGCFKNYTGVQGRILLNSYLDCEFYIIAPENHTISLYFNAYYALDDCENQFFSVYEADTGKELAKKCGQLEPASSIFTETNHVQVKVKNRGIFANYDATFLASNMGRGCGGRLRNYGGIFTSPLYPLNVRNDSDCRWDIEVPNNMKVAIIFDVFDLGAKLTCRSDYLQLIELEDSGEEVARQYCGEDKPSPYRGRRNKIAVRYRKSVHMDGTGWVIRFGAVHDDTKLMHFNGEGVVEV